MSKPVLLLQSRPEDDVSDNEYESICRLGGIDPKRVERLRMDRDKLRDIQLHDYSAVIMGGGPANFASPDDEKSEEQKRFEPWLIALMKQIVVLDVPFFGMCLGMGSVAMAHGMQPSFEYDETLEPIEIELTEDGRRDPLLEGLPDSFMALSGHNEGIGEVPIGTAELANSRNCVHIIRSGQNVYATQFHPELDLPGLALRVKAYRDHGYFPPEEGDEVLRKATEIDFADSVRVLQNFVKLYVL